MEILAWIKSIQFLKEPIIKILALFNLKTENDVLKEKLKEAENRLQILEEQIIEIHNNPLTFNEKTGTWISASNGLHYCAKCKAETITSPLKNVGYGWTCLVCNSFFNDPSKQQPSSQLKIIGY